MNAGVRALYCVSAAMANRILADYPQKVKLSSIAKGGIESIYY